jgi:hypothetical protein
MDKLTEMEKTTLAAICNDDIIADYGWWSKDASFWIGGYWEDAAVEKGVACKKSLRGLLSSLVKKGFVDSDGASAQLTDKARNYIKTNIESFNVPKIFEEVDNG